MDNTKMSEAALTKQIKALVLQGRYEEAERVLENIDIHRIRNNSILCLVGETYMGLERYDEAERVLLRVYERQPNTRRILDLLTNLYIYREEYSEAEYYYKEFIGVASKDLHRYILRYRLDKAKGERISVLIDTLEKLKDYEYIEEWAYELAALYEASGQTKKCLHECDEIILWFGHGEYVDKAIALKCSITGEPLPESIAIHQEEAVSAADTESASEEGEIPEIAKEPAPEEMESSQAAILPPEGEAKQQISAAAGSSAEIDEGEALAMQVAADISQESPAAGEAMEAEESSALPQISQTGGFRDITPAAPAEEISQAIDDLVEAADQGAEELGAAEHTAEVLTAAEQVSAEPGAAGQTAEKDGLQEKPVSIKVETVRPVSGLERPFDGSIDIEMIEKALARRKINPVDVEVPKDADGQAAATLVYDRDKVRRIVERTDEEVPASDEKKPSAAGMNLPAEKPVEEKRTPAASQTNEDAAEQTISDEEKSPARGMFGKHSFREFWTDKKNKVRDKIRNVIEDQLPENIMTGSKVSEKQPEIESVSDVRPVDTPNLHDQSQGDEKKPAVQPLMADVTAAAEEVPVQAETVSTEEVTAAEIPVPEAASEALREEELSEGKETEVPGKKQPESEAQVQEPEEDIPEAEVSVPEKDISGMEVSEPEADFPEADAQAPGKDHTEPEEDVPLPQEFQPDTEKPDDYKELADAVKDFFSQIKPDTASENISAQEPVERELLTDADAEEPDAAVSLPVREEPDTAGSADEVSEAAEENEDIISAENGIGQDDYFGDLFGRIREEAGIPDYDEIEAQEEETETVYERKIPAGADEEFVSAREEEMDIDEDTISDTEDAFGSAVSRESASSRRIMEELALIFGEDEDEEEELPDEIPAPETIPAQENMAEEPEEDRLAAEDFEIEIVDEDEEDEDEDEILTEDAIQEDQYLMQESSGTETEPEDDHVSADSSEMEEEPRDSEEVRTETEEEEEEEEDDEVLPDDFFGNNDFIFIPNDEDLTVPEYEVMDAEADSVRLPQMDEDADDGDSGDAVEAADEEAGEEDEILETEDVSAPSAESVQETAEEEAEEEPEAEDQDEDEEEDEIIEQQDEDIFADDDEDDGDEIIGGFPESGPDLFFARLFGGQTQTDASVQTQESADKGLADDGAFLSEEEEDEEDDVIVASKASDTVMDIFQEVAQVTSIQQQLTQTFTKFEDPSFDNIDLLAPYDINFVVTGDDMSVKSQIAIGIAKALNTYGVCDKNKLVRATADDLNARDFSSIFPKLSGGCLIIDSADKLNERAAGIIAEYVQGEDQDVSIVLEGEEGPLMEMFASYPVLRGKFLNVIHIGKYNEEELVQLADGYARKNGYSISPQASLVLKRRIQKLLDDGAAVNYDDIMAMVDDAIAGLEHRNMKNLFMTVLDNKYEEAAMFLIQPEDFLEKH